MTLAICEKYEKYENDDEWTEGESATDPYNAVFNWHRALHEPVVWGHRHVDVRPRPSARHDYLFGQVLETLKSARLALISISASESLELEALERAIVDSDWMLRLEPGWDDAEAVAISKKTWERATSSVRILARDVFASCRQTPPVPRIGPVSDGSIDLFWNMDGHNLLINIPADDGAEATFDGHRPDGNSITGALMTFETIGHLSAWLMNR